MASKACAENPSTRRCFPALALPWSSCVTLSAHRPVIFLWVTDERFCPICLEPWVAAWYILTRYLVYLMMSFTSIVIRFTKIGPCTLEQTYDTNTLLRDGYNRCQSPSHNYGRWKWPHNLWSFEYVENLTSTSASFSHSTPFQPFLLKPPARICRNAENNTCPSICINTDRVCLVQSPQPISACQAARPMQIAVKKLGS